jgi:hypothetical protein
LRWESPAWFAQSNAKGETNLHNLLGNKPSHRLRTLADIAYPFCCIVLPLVYQSRPGSYRIGHWSHYLLPRVELIGLVLTGMVINAADDLSVSALGAGLIRAPGEIKELYLGAATLLYALVMWQRLAPANAAVETIRLHVYPQLPAQELRTLRKAA